MKKLSLRCISVIMALLFAFAPLSSAFAIKIPWLISYPSEKEIAETLGGYLKARDVDGIVGMFSEEVKSEIPALNTKVESWLEQIECDIDEYRYLGRGGFDESNYGYYHKSCSFELEIRTEDWIYIVIAHYIQAWTDNEKAVGLSSLALTLLDSKRNLVDYLDGVEIERPSKLSLNYKDTYQFRPCEGFWKDTYSSIGYKKLVLESSDESVAVIDENGIVTAVGIGVSHITVKYVNETTGKKHEFLYDVTVTFTTWQKIIWFLFFGFLWY